MNWPEAFVSTLAASWWVIGIAVSKGWWMLLAIFVPPAAWVLAAQWLLLRP
jgi:hypothetical protein